MNLSGLDIVPTEGMVAVRFVDDDDDDSTMSSGEPEYDGLLAIVVAAGPKTSVKKGQIIVTRPWARDGLKVGEAVLIDSYQIAATLK